MIIIILGIQKLLVYLIFSGNILNSPKIDYY